LKIEKNNTEKLDRLIEAGCAISHSAVLMKRKIVAVFPFICYNRCNVAESFVALQLPIPLFKAPIFRHAFGLRKPPIPPTPL
jgi:hypothetical protein